MNDDDTQGDRLVKSLLIENSTEHGTVVVAGEEEILMRREFSKAGELAMAIQEVISASWRSGRDYRRDWAGLLHRVAGSLGNGHRDHNWRLVVVRSGVRPFLATRPTPIMWWATPGWARFFWPASKTNG